MKKIILLLHFVSVVSIVSALSSPSSPSPSVEKAPKTSLKQRQNNDYQHSQVASLLSQKKELQSPSLLNDNNDNDVMRKDIEIMKKEAIERLGKISVQMNELENAHPEVEQSLPLSSSSPSGGVSINSSDVADSSSKTTRMKADIASPTASSSSDSINNDEIEKDEKEESDKDEILLTISSFLGFGATEKKDLEIPASSDTKTTKELSDPHIQASDQCLDDTRWKIVFRMEKNYQTEEKLDRPLMIHTVLDFTPESLAPPSTERHFNNNNDDEFLYWTGSGGTVNRRNKEQTIPKQVRILEAYQGPTSLTDNGGCGRRSILNIDPLGGWRVIHGKGSRGMDVLRFYFDVHDSDNTDTNTDDGVSLLPGRYYATCGYFSMENQAETIQYKCQLQKELDDLAERYHNLQSGNGSGKEAGTTNNNNGNIFIKKMKQVHESIKLENKIREVEEKISIVTQRDPSKSVLRLSRRGDIGLTKVGQLCKQINTVQQENRAMLTKASPEYRLIGKMEMVSIEKKELICAPKNVENRNNDLHM